jgi:hypothetical protein
MNSPSREGSRGYRLFLKNLSFGLALMVFGVKGGWIIDKDWGTVRVGSSVCSLVVTPNIERMISIQIKIRVFLLIGKEEMFESV